jgi:outer membrane immunogenic protein
MTRKIVAALCGLVVLLVAISAHAGQSADAALKITRRSVAEGIGLTWGEGVLTFQNKEYPFTFHATGRLRDVDVKMTTAELSGQVFNLKTLDDFAGNYKASEGEKSTTGGGTRVTVQNQKGVVVNLVSSVDGRKFSVARAGIDIELKQAKR